ncbi:uncharacterized protein [Aegilops tauschii subsp. strangulata]|uniref:uncharacterized protein n=1 Tax=Aegilops tauschii subsp. strangulata TaxID=200361 RepID=UPI001ABC0EA0|nr:uncharacterized protein LOC120966644 [Aegilops tauschii subsp. strangulata]
MPPSSRGVAAVKAANRKPSCPISPMILSLKLWVLAFVNNFAYLPALGTRGGVLIAASSDHYTITPQPLLIGAYSVSVLVTELASNAVWSLTGVYGPQEDADKILFLNEMRALQPMCKQEWIIMGDFNLISRMDEKSNGNVNLAMLRRFQAAIDNLNLKELPLIGRRFHLNFSNQKFSGFRFEAWWPKAAGFQETVSEAWNKPLDIAQESRNLSPEEFELRRLLKSRLLVFAALERIKWRQRSRLVWIRAGDANTRLFHLRANGRRRKNHIPFLHMNGTVISDKDDKAAALLNHFSRILGPHDDAPAQTVNWDYLQLPRTNLSHLDAPFDQDELLKAIKDSPSEKAPGPDGFIGLFYKVCWNTIKVDLLAALNQLSALNANCWNLLNTAYIALIPKKDNALRPSDYRPISLTHSVAKLLGKMLATRLAPEMQHLISHSQSAFLKNRSIQDNFLYVQNLIRNLHRSKEKAIFIKLDIAKAFDSVRWSYLLDALAQFGFGQRFRDLIALSLASTSSRVMLNGTPGPPFYHRRGLRQGDPLSPFLFLLAIEPLQSILSKASDANILSPIALRSAKLRISLYADDAALFINPVKEEVASLLSILAIFGQISGLHTNFSKSSAFPINCESDETAYLLADFEGETRCFPCKYLGLPLGLRNPRRADFQALIDKIIARLARWKGKLLNKAGTSTLQVCSPKNCGGLDIKNLDLFSRALRIRWLWFAWERSSRPSIGSNTPCSPTDHQLFNASTTVTLGNGATTSFWSNRWLNGSAPKDIAPSLFPLAARKCATVAAALTDGRWMKGLQRLNSPDALHEFINLWGLIQHITLSNIEDSICWNWTTNGVYSAKTAYNAQFFGTIAEPALAKIWSMRMEAKVKFFAWLLTLNRLPTVDRLRARGGTQAATCVLCDQQPETALHLTTHCSYSKEVWHLLGTFIPTLHLLPMPPFQGTEEWWLHFSSMSKHTAAAAAYHAWHVL